MFEDYLIVWHMCSPHAAITFQDIKYELEGWDYFVNLSAEDTL